MRLSRTTEMSRLARAFEGAAVGHDHRAGRNPRRMHHRHAGERFEHGREEAEGDRAAVATRNGRRSYPRVGVWSFTPGTPRAADNAGIQPTHLGLATCPF